MAPFKQNYNPTFVMPTNFSDVPDHLISLTVSSGCVKEDKKSLVDYYYLKSLYRK